MSNFRRLRMLKDNGIVQDLEGNMLTFKGAVFDATISGAYVYLTMDQPWKRRRGQGVMDRNPRFTLGDEGSLYEFITDKPEDF